MGISDYAPAQGTQKADQGEVLMTLSKEGGYARQMRVRISANSPTYEQGQAHKRRIYDLDTNQITGVRVLWGLR